MIELPNLSRNSTCDAQRETSLKVSVCVITYNQERYIRQCLQSIIDQQTSFDFEIIVGDDCSTDGTSTILQEFANKYPTIVRVISQQVNTRGTKNLLDVHASAKGEYICHIDGDDVALPLKLQTQADFLDSHQQCSLVAHDVQVIDCESRISKPSWAPHLIPEFTDISYLVTHGCFFAHSSKMYRRSSMRTKVRTVPTVDFYFHLEHVSSGLIGYIDKPLGQYRRTGSGIAGNNEFILGVLQSYLDAYEYALKCGVAPDIVNRARLKFKYINAMHCVRRGNYEGLSKVSAVAPSEQGLLTLREKLVFGMMKIPKVMHALIGMLDRLRGRN